jgi:hypothetical protein
MKNMISKYPGICRNCGESVQAGSSIVYHGKGNGITCAHCAALSEEISEDCAGMERGTLASDRRLADRGLSVIRFSSGESFTRNRRGRCEDAPCCGCCTT